MTSQLDLAADAVERTLVHRPGAEVFASADRNRHALTRFANSIIHQNVDDDVTELRLTVHAEGRTASVSSTVVSADDVPGLVDRAIAAARVAPLDPSWPGLAVAAPVAVANDGGDVVAPALRAQVVRDFVDAAGGLETAGFCRTSLWASAFASSSGQTALGAGNECGFSGIARNRGDGGVFDGLARHAPMSIGGLDGAALGAVAAAKARAAADPVELPPGRYEVVLEPAAVADIVESIAAIGFNGKLVNEQRSFVRIGEAQFDQAITLVDQPLALGRVYDDEGTPRRDLVLVERGTSANLTHDRRSAAEAGGAAASTGHALREMFGWGPTAQNVTLLPSDRADGPSAADGPFADLSVAELVADVERGLLVSDFWYTRMLDPRALTITGLTRNGLWLIEDGVVTKALRNFRFTQSYAQALMPGNVRGVGRIAIPLPGDTYSASSPRWTCPALHLGSWNFTGGASG